MMGEQVAFLAVPAEMASRRILPDIRPVAAVLSQLDVVARSGARLCVDEDKLVLRPQKTSETGPILDPLSSFVSCPALALLAPWRLIPS